jgi:hypothetical protein
VALGGAKDLSAIAAARSLEHLELCWIKGFADVSFLADCATLEHLVLDRLSQVTDLPDFSRMKRLRRLGLMTLKSLKSVDRIADATALEWFGFSEASQFQPADFAKALTAPSLREARVGFGNKARSHEFEEMAAARGLTTGHWHTGS